MKSPLHQDISGCFQSLAGLREADLAPLLQRCEITRVRLEKELAAGELPCLSVALDGADLGELQSVAADWRQRFKRVVLFGIGGSSLGARALTALQGGDGPELVISDSLNTELVADLLRPDVLSETGFLAISKSGGTAEPLSQAIAAVAAMRQHLGGEVPAKQFLAISEPGDGALRRLAGEIDAPVLDHDPDIGGRFSVLSLVGLLPTLIRGLDATAVRDGAKAVLDAAMAGPDSDAAIGAALQVAFRDKGMGQSVLLAYGDGFEHFARWYRQLWAESLGKDGQGTTPIDALGPVDQHSQLQLYLNGPLDKQFTVLTVSRSGQGPVVDEDLARSLGQDYMAGKRIGDLVAAMQSATADTLIRNGRPVRRLSAETLDERTLGALFMHFMLETLFAADLMGVDPFGQPAVEEGKNLARKYLRGEPS